MKRILLLMAAFLYMLPGFAQIKVSALPTDTTVADTDYIIINKTDSGKTKKILAKYMLKYIAGVVTDSTKNGYVPLGIGLNYYGTSQIKQGLHGNTHFICVVYVDSSQLSANPIIDLRANPSKQKQYHVMIWTAKSDSTFKVRIYGGKDSATFGYGIYHGGASYKMEFGDKITADRHDTCPDYNIMFAGREDTNRYMATKHDVAMAGGGSGWSLTGNTGLTPAVNHIGNNDSATLVLMVDNTQSGWIDDGNSSSSYDNTFFGYYSGFSDNVGTLNTAVGNHALANNTNGFTNVAVGARALFTNFGGSDNIGVGYEALYSNINGPDNAAVGYNALGQNISGQGNIGIGTEALNANTRGSFNIGIGVSSLSSCTTTGYNVALGYSCLSAITGGKNVGIGSLAGQPNGYNGTGNVVIGYQAAYTPSTGDYNIFIGYQADATNALTNVVSIGYGSQATVSNSVILGNFNTTIFQFSGDIQPYYNSQYNASKSGQLLFGKGTGNSPQWQGTYSQAVYTPSTGNSIGVVPNRFIVVNPAGPIAALTLDFSAAITANNDIVEIKFEQPVTTISYTVGGNTVFGQVTTVTAGTTLIWVSDFGDSYWY